MKSSKDFDAHNELVESSAKGKYLKLGSSTVSVIFVTGDLNSALCPFGARLWLKYKGIEAYKFWGCHHWG